MQHSWKSWKLEWLYFAIVVFESLELSAAWESRLGLPYFVINIGKVPGVGVPMFRSARIKIKSGHVAEDSIIYKRPHTAFDTELFTFQFPSSFRRRKILKQTIPNNNWVSNSGHLLIYLYVESQNSCLSQCSHTLRCKSIFVQHL